MRVRVKQAIGWGSAAYVAVKAVRGLAALADGEHTGGATRAGRGAPGDAEHAHLLGSRYFVNKDGLYISWRRWEPQGEWNGHVVVLVHGFGEHIGRYESVAAALTAAGFKVLGLDHQGHGCSEGDRAYVKSVWDFVDDVVQLAREKAGAREDAPVSERKVFLLGHSMGGLIAALTVLREPQLFAGFVLSGPALKADPKVATPMMITLARGLSAALPKLELDPIDSSKVCRSQTVVKQYCLDPLNYTGGMRTRMGAEMLGGMDYVIEHRASLTLPFLIQHGTADALCLPAGSLEFFDAASSEDKSKLMYDGWYHEIYNECEADCGLQNGAAATNTAVRDAVAWLAERASPGWERVTTPLGCGQQPTL